MARPTKYTKNVRKIAKNYLQGCINNRRIPFISELASMILGIHRDTLNNWARKQDPSGELLFTLSKIKTVQRWLLMDKSLKGEINSKFAIFLLKNNHGMSDKNEKCD